MSGYGFYHGRERQADLKAVNSLTAEGSTDRQVMSGVGRDGPSTGRSRHCKAEGVPSRAEAVRVGRGDNIKEG